MTSGVTKPSRATKPCAPSAEWQCCRSVWPAAEESLSIGYFIKEEDAIAASDVYQEAKWGNRD